MTHSISVPMDSGMSAKSPSGSQISKGVPSSRSCSHSSRRSSTWPRLNGTAAGNSSAQGHSASSTRMPASPSPIHWLRKALQRATAPSFSSTSASTAPSRVPAALSTKSMLEGTRRGR